VTRPTTSLTILLALACTTKSSSPPAKFAEPEPTGVDRPTLVVGEYGIDDEAVIDGDTIRVMGVEQSLRLLGIDTEETFKFEADRRAADSNWDAYRTSKMAGADKPVKFATPLGEEGKTFAKEFFSEARAVRLERDHPLETRGRYGRLLTYVFIKRGGEWLNYNVEAVRAGMTPYFMKYGYSRRFHDAFEAAMAEARSAKRGIWNVERYHYPDYDQRLPWWRARADALNEFVLKSENQEDHVILTRSNAIARIEARMDKTVVLFGTVGNIRELRSGKRIVYMGRKKGADFPVVFETTEIFEGTHVADFAMEFIEIRGKVTVYTHPSSGKEELQVLVQHPGQVSTTKVWPPG